VNLNSLGWKMHDHLKKFRPKMFQELKQDGSLNQYLSNLQEQIGRQLDDLENSGMDHYSAMEMLQDQIYPPAEEDQPTLGQPIQPYRDRPSPKPKPKSPQSQKPPRAPISA
jgi:hypothetical protein